jgi:hypothetical protein
MANSRIYEFTVGVETSVQPDAGVPTLANDVVTKGYVDALPGSGDKCDRIALNTTDVSKSIVFATPFAGGTVFEVFAQIKDLTMTAVDQNKFPINITAQSVNGFTATWDSQVGSTTAFLSWQAVVKNNS